jgi:hypothetical protein
VLLGYNYPTLGTNMHVIGGCLDGMFEGASGCRCWSCVSRQGA